jgi:hypothetical protein
MKEMNCICLALAWSILDGLDLVMMIPRRKRISEEEHRAQLAGTYHATGADTSTQKNRHELRPPQKESHYFSSSRRTVSSTPFSVSGVLVIAPIRYSTFPKTLE